MAPGSLRSPSQLAAPSPLNRNSAKTQTSVRGQPGELPCFLRNAWSRGASSCAKSSGCTSLRAFSREISTVLSGRPRMLAQPEDRLTSSVGISMAKLPTRAVLLASPSCVLRSANLSSASLRSVISRLLPRTRVGLPVACHGCEPNRALPSIAFFGANEQDRRYIARPLGGLEMDKPLEMGALEDYADVTWQSRVEREGHPRAQPPVPTRGGVSGRFQQYEHFRACLLGRASRGRRGLGGQAYRQPAREQVFLAVVLHRLLPEISMHSPDLIGRAALRDSLHESEVFHYATAHEVLPFACERSETFMNHGIPFGYPDQPGAPDVERPRRKSIRQPISRPIDPPRTPVRHGHAPL